MRVPEFSLADLRTLASDLHAAGSDVSLLEIVVENIAKSAGDGDDVSPTLQRVAHHCGDGSIFGTSPAASTLAAVLARFDPAKLHEANRHAFVAAEQAREEQETSELFETGELRMGLGNADARAERIVDRFFGKKANA